MNLITAIILVTLVSEFLLKTVSDYFNLKSAEGEIPPEFKEIYNAGEYRKSQAYLKSNTTMDWISSASGLLILLLFWFLKGFAHLDSLVTGMGLGPVTSGIVYIGMLLVANSLLSLPFSVYSTFVIEEKFGFNKTTLKIFITDKIKGVALGTIIGVPLLAAILTFFQYSGPNAWLYCWISVTCFMFIMQYIFPTWIMPFFNKFEPVEEGKLKQSIINYADSINFPLENLFVMDGSKRSTRSNAFFTGFGKNRRIVLFDTLIKKHTTSELVSVIAHEMGHFKKKHIIKSMVISVLHTGVLFYLMSLFLSSRPLFDAFFMDHTSVYAGLIFFSLLFSPVEFFLAIFMQILSRKNEYEADQFAVDTTGDPGALSEALKKLSVNNLSNLTPHPLYVFLNYSHPPLMQRLHAIRKKTLTNPNPSVYRI